MAIFGNFKGTTQSDFKIGKSDGTKISTGDLPTSDLSAGDLYIDSSNTTIQVYNSGWKNIGLSLPELNVDSGTLYVDSSNDTVSIGSTSSNEKLFVNGSLRLGTNPTIKYSGAYLDVNHANGTGTVLRLRDNASGSDPIFKIYNAGNSAEVFKVDGDTTTINNAYSLPTADGSADQYLKTDGAGALSFASVEGVSLAGSNTEIQFNDSGSQGADASLTFDKATDTFQTGVVRGVLFEPIDDYGSVATSANINIDYGAVTEIDTNIGDFEHILKLYGDYYDHYTVSKLPPVTVSGQMIYVTDETGGATMAFSDGSDWRRIQDRAVVS